MERITAFKEWFIYTRQYVRMILSDKKNLLVSLLFPVLAAFIVIMVAGENMFVHMEGTKSANFVIVSAAIWGGLFNSIQVVVKSRAVIKRDYIAGARIASYTCSRAFIQFFLCAFQSLILTLSYKGVEMKYGNEIPTEGIIFDSVMVEYYISILLLMYAADALGLMISCIVKKAETANVLAPYILIVQLIFSGTLFEMKGNAKVVSYAMISKWGMEALGSTSNLNDLVLRTQLELPNIPIPHPQDEMFTYTTGHMLMVWGILLGFSIISILIGNLLLYRVSKDGR